MYVTLLNKQCKVRFYQHLNVIVCLRQHGDYHLSTAGVLTLLDGSFSKRPDDSLVLKPTRP